MFKAFEPLLTQPLANGLIVFYKLLWSNMGLAIIGFSIFLRIILNPLTKPYMESVKKMKEHQPQLNKLKNKYKGDKVKYAQAQADYYRNKGIKPGAGCLPYILQIVVLIAFFNVFTRTLSPDVNTTQKFNELLYAPLRFEQGVEVNTKFLYLDVTQPDKINIPSIPFSLPGPILILAALTQLLSAKIMAPYSEIEEKVAKKTKEKEDDIQVAMQRSMIFTFPLFTLIIGLKFASGLAIYWLVFSLTQAHQQYTSQGWGGLSPWIKKLGLLKLQNKS
jgi:YidC/Oxa1 family membrane protein insertase